MVRLVIRGVRNINFQNETVYTKFSLPKIYSEWNDTKLGLYKITKTDMKQDKQFFIHKRQLLLCLDNVAILSNEWSGDLQVLHFAKLRFVWDRMF